ncbi:MAG: YbbR-like domain-containing protein, partial [Bacteroidota bacterium]
LQSTGYNILLRKFKQEKHHLEIDLSQYSPKLQGNNFEINIDMDGFREKLATDFKQKDKMVAFMPQNLNVRLDKAFIKKVPVVLDADISFEKQYGLYHKVLFTPDSVLVTGNQDLLKTITSVKTEQRTFNNLSSNTSVSLKLVNNYNPLNLRYSVDYVKVFIPVVQYAEDFVEVPVLTDSVGWDEHIVTNPAKVKVYYTVCIPDIKNVATDSFRVSVKIPSTFTPSATSITKVTIKHSPAWVKILRIEPENVEYTIKK